MIIPRIQIQDGTFALPMSRAFKREHREIRLSVPELLQDKKIKEIRIHPRYQAQFVE